VTAQRLIYAQRDRLTSVWAKGHRGEPLNEGVDAFARLASRYATGTSELTKAEYHRGAARRGTASTASPNVFVGRRPESSTNTTARTCWWHRM
jgi:hypothetical protein